MLPGTIDGMKHVCYFRHALALDERRVKFLPEYAYGGTSVPCGASKNGSPHTDNHRLGLSGNTDDPIANKGPSDDGPPVDNDAIHDRSQSRIKLLETRPHTREVWFAGTHSDM